MSLADAAAMQREWRARPPVHWLVAEWLEYEGDDDDAALLVDGETIDTKEGWLSWFGGN